MQDSTANKAQKDNNSENEVEVLHSLAILELIVMNSAKERMLKNGDFLSVKAHDVSQIGETDKLKELFSVSSKNVPKSESEKKVICMNEFREERNKGFGRMEQWGLELRKFIWRLLIMW